MEEELENKYKLNTELNEFQKTRIKNLFHNSIKNNSILTHSIDQKEIYKNPYKSQQTL